MKWRWKIAQAAEIRWWRQYLSKKSTTDYLSWKKAYWRNFLSTLAIQLATGERVLDAGCGPAGIFMVLDQQQVDALDPLLGQYEEQLDHFNKGLYPRVRFVDQPLEQFDQPVVYDTVFCLNAINHVADLNQCFDQLVHYTKPGGRLVVSIDAHNWVFCKHIFRWLPGDVLHPHQFDLGEYKGFLTERGCTVEQSVRLDKGFLFDYWVLVVRNGRGN